MGYQVYEVGPRWGGYGVPAICEQPECNEKIDRGMSYACGGEPFSQYGCDRYFCGKHLHDTCFDPEEKDGLCKHEDDCDCEAAMVCARCRHNNAVFPYKPETKEWARHLLKDPSWKEWRENNPDDVKEMKKILRKERHWCSETCDCKNKRETN